MARDVSVRELRNHTSNVVAAVRGGERVTLTVNREAVADIVPHVGGVRSPWVPASQLRALLAVTGADAALLGDLQGVRDLPLEE